MSSINYIKVNCQVPRKEMVLQFMSYDQHFGRGNNTTTMSPEDEWRYPIPNSVREGFINIVCTH